MLLVVQVEQLFVLFVQVLQLVVLVKLYQECSYFELIPFPFLNLTFFLSSFLTLCLMHFVYSIYMKLTCQLLTSNIIYEKELVYSLIPFNSFSSIGLLSSSGNSPYISIYLFSFSVFVFNTCNA